jgi:hypothetical protein
MKMVAASTRGELVAGGSDGFGLAFKAGALWVGTTVEVVDGPAGRMAATAAAVSRLRTALESSRGFTLRGWLWRLRTAHQLLGDWHCLQVENLQRG